MHQPDRDPASIDLVTEHMHRCNALFSCMPELLIFKAILHETGPHFSECQKISKDMLWCGSALPSLRGILQNTDAATLIVENMRDFLRCGSEMLDFEANLQSERTDSTAKAVVLMTMRFRGCCYALMF